jgi:DNA-binding NarL/FixJ family response regulator
VIAEDFVLIQENIRALLEDEFDVVAAVEDGQSALEAVANGHPDVLLVDISLPVLTGLKVAEKLRESDSQVRVMFVTAHRDREYVQRAFETGAKGYVLKGSIATELVPAVRAVLAGGVYRSPSLR